MKKQDIINKIETAGYTHVKTEIEENKSVGNYSFVNLLGFTMTNGVLNQRWFRIIENTQTEEAWWRGEDQLAPRPETFNQRVEDYIQVRIDDGTIKAGFIQDINSDHKRAEIKAVYKDGSGSTITNNFLIKDVGGTLSHEIIS